LHGHITNTGLSLSPTFHSAIRTIRCT